MSAQTQVIREVYGRTLVELGERDPRIAVVDADMAPGTFTTFFSERFPERWFDVGVAEQNLVALGAGLALGGHIPFVNTFAYLLSLRAAEQVRTLLCYADTNVKLAAGYAGLSGSMDGGSHTAVVDIAAMRALPNLTIVSISDGIMARKATIAAAEHVGPLYQRMSRNEAYDIHDPDFDFVIGQGITLRNGGDVTIVGTGDILWRCLQAAEILANAGIDARVLEIHTIKPIDSALLELAAEETGAIVTVEEHSVIGGLGAAVCETLAERRPVPVMRVGVQDEFPGTGAPDTLKDCMGMSVDDIVAAARRALELKR